MPAHKTIRRRSKKRNTKTIKRSGTRRRTKRGGNAFRVSDLKKWIHPIHEGGSSSTPDDVQMYRDRLFEYEPTV
jgi:hypothetical protein